MMHHQQKLLQHLHPHPHPNPHHHHHQHPPPPARQQIRLLSQLLLLRPRLLPVTTRQCQPSLRIQPPPPRLHFTPPPLRSLFTSSSPRMDKNSFLPKGFEKFFGEEAGSTSGRSGRSGGKKSSESSSSSSSSSSKEASGRRRPDPKEESSESSSESLSSSSESSGGDKKAKNSLPPKPPPPQPSQETTNVVGLLLLALALFLVTSAQNPMQSSNVITWQKFHADLLRKGEVDRVVVVNNQVARVYLRPDSPLFRTQRGGGGGGGMSRTGHQYEFQIGSLDQFERKMDTAQAEMGIPDDQRIPVSFETATDVGSVLYGFLPVLLSAGLFYFTIKRLSGGGRGGGPGGIFSMNKSKAKLFNQETDVKVKFKVLSPISHPSWRFCSHLSRPCFTLLITGYRRHGRSQGGDHGVCQVFEGSSKV